MKISKGISKWCMAVAAAAAISVLFAGCSNIFGGGSGSSGSDIAETGKRVADLIADAAMTLPASLSESGDGSTQSLTTQALVDTTQLDPVKSDARIDMMEAMDQNIVRELMGVLRDYFDGDPAGPDQDIDLGEHTVGGMTMDMGVMRYTEDQDADEVDVYWAFRVGDDTNYADMHVHVHISPDTSTSATDDYVMEFNAAPADVGGNPPIPSSEFNVYAQYSQATGESLEYVDFGGESSDYAFNLVQKVPDSDTNEVALYSADQFSYTIDDSKVTSTWKRVGWGDDGGGGIIQAGSDDVGSFAFREYYNSNGNLIQRGYGSDSADMLGPLQMVDQSESAGTAKNVYDLQSGSVPETVYVAETGSSSYEISLTADSSDVQTHSNELYDLYWKADSSVWQENDAVYFNDSWEQKDWNGDGNKDTWVGTYTVGFTVPSSDTVFGSSYFFSTERPLNFVSPADGYTIRRDAESDFPFFWLESDDNDTWNSGEPQLDIFQSENWVYNETTGEWEQQETPAYLIFGNLPANLSFDSTMANLQSSIQTEIDAVYQDYSSYNASDYSDAHAMPASSQFPEL